MVAPHEISFMARVRFDEEGKLVCFCHQREPGQSVPECQEEYDCPEARISVAVIAGTRPSEKKVGDIKRQGRELKGNLAGTIRGAEKIKQGLLELEKSVKKNSRFRI